MVNESVYVAIAIACVVALLMLAIFVIYCIKRQQDKIQERQARERRIREERQRRNHMRVPIVGPPPYEASRGMHQTGFSAHREIPYSPPPEYKEVATPLPTPRHNQSVGIGGVSDRSYGYPPEYNEIPTVSRNVAPANTYFVGSGYYNNLNNANVSTNESTSGNNNTVNHINNRNLYNQSARRANVVRSNDSTIQVQVSPRVPSRAAAAAALPDVVTSTGVANGDRSTHQIRQDIPNSSSTYPNAYRARPNLEATTEGNNPRNQEIQNSRSFADSGHHNREIGSNAEAANQPQTTHTGRYGYDINRTATYPNTNTNISRNEVLRRLNTNQAVGSNSSANESRISTQLQDLSLI
ncbi:PX domain-containing protein kinase-like protein [Plakobranchus ocellatus]|uniref:PX domain-containing protein kinase-like protein n=1 Tax=Plakobranchus ocellatus TaxID=259542 RepID=A0AAV4DM75_9GAST|nr:PX domain-containing protein kinase-like protein [Plakobranchus ocellatus]